MTPLDIKLVSQTARVPSTRVPLDAEQELRVARLLEQISLVDFHQHPLVLPEDLAQVAPYLRSDDLTWGYEAVRHGGWSAVASASIIKGYANSTHPAFVQFSDLTDEIGLMLADMEKNKIPALTRASEIREIKRRDQFGFIPSVEYLAIGSELHRVDVLYGLGVRIAGLTYDRRSLLGDGQSEPEDGGIGELGVEAIRRMNDLGMIIDLSHASARTAKAAIGHSRQPVVFSHNAAYALRPTRRARKDDELLACTRNGGLVCVAAVPNALSDDPRQDINCVLDHIDYLVRLVGIEHVGIGTDTIVGDHVGLQRTLMAPMMGNRDFPAPYLDGLESPADGANLVRGLVTRGYPDDAIARIAGDNALRLFAEVAG